VKKDRSADLARKQALLEQERARQSAIAARSPGAVTGRREAPPRRVEMAPDPHNRMAPEPFRKA